MTKATGAEIITAYQETGSVWAAGKRLGMAGQSVHERLVAVGYPLAGRNWTDDERAELRNLMDQQLTLGEIARRLGRPYAGIACQLNELGIRSTRPRTRKLPRGQGYTKPEAARHMTALESSPLRVTQYARTVGMDVEMLAQCIERNYPERWAAYVAAHSDIPHKKCPYCSREFVPASGKQTYCTRKCAADARADRNYFGGNRRQTIGLSERICQLCGRRDMKGLSAHHIWGKENDPDNQQLVALCPGCHQLVTLLAGRAFVDDPVVWQSLIALVWMRAHGAEIAADPTGMIYTEVTIEPWPADDE